jgi:hypothetical protein
MTGLERHAHRLVELARAGDDPTATQLMGLHGSVAARIAAEGSLAPATTAGATKTLGSSLLAKGLAAAASVALGSAAVFAVTTEPEPAALPPAPAAHRLALQAPALPRAAVSSDQRAASRVGEEPASSLRVEATSPTPRQTKAAPSLRLQDEAALLAEVQGALRSGSSSLALAKLETYDRKFPTGMLRTEADAAKVFALCAAGRVEKARSAAARFVQRYPTAPATARVQAACK